MSARAKAVDSMSDETYETRLKRLQYRSNYTGTKETDTILGRFAAAYLGALEPHLLDQYEALIENSDPDLYMWISGRKPVPPEWDNDVMDLLKRFRVEDRKSKRLKSSH